MKRQIYLCIILLFVCTAIGCGKTGSSGAGDEDSRGSALQEESANDFDEGRNNRISSTEELDTGEEKQVSDTELRKLELTLESYWNSYEELREQAESYDRMEQGMSEADMKDLVRSEVLRCYEENTLLAVEIKTLVMGSVGVSVPTGFSTGEDAMRSYSDYVENTLSSIVNVQGVIDEIASPEVQEVLKNGMSGAIEVYQNQGNLEDILYGAALSVMDGVKAKIQEEVKTYAIGILDETTYGLYSTFQEMSQYNSLQEYLESKVDAGKGGLITSLEGFTGYDSTPGALLQGVSDSANSSVAEIKKFLDCETVTSENISEMMYQFSQFGYAMQTLSYYGASVDFSWKDNYDKMEILYKRFLCNEIMIQLLGDKGDVTEPVIQEQFASEYVSNSPEINYLYEKPGLTPEEKNGDNAVRYEILLSQLEELEEALKEVQQRLDNVPQAANDLAKYRNQMTELNGECSNILSYSVKNFQAAYDDEGIEQMRKINSINNTIGEIAKWTPYGVVINLISSMNIAGSDVYYSNMASTNEAFARAYQRAVLEAIESLSTLEVMLDFYNGLVEESEDAVTEYNHLNLLRYLLDDGDIDISQYEREVKKSLYLLAVQTDAMGKIYRALYTDGSAADTYRIQYEEIMAVIDPQGTGGMTELLTAEELAEYLQPILESGVVAIRNVEGIVDAPNRKRTYTPVYRSNGVPGGKIWCLFIGDELVHVKHEDSWIDIYYSAGEPLCINGYYVYDGVILNGGEATDSDTACQEAVWVWENVWNNAQGFRTQCSARVGNMKAALWGGST